MERTDCCECVVWRESGKEAVENNISEKVDAKKRGRV